MPGPFARSGTPATGLCFYKRVIALENPTFRSRLWSTGGVCLTADLGPQRPLARPARISLVAPLLASVASGTGVSCPPAMKLTHNLDQQTGMLSHGAGGWPASGFTACGAVGPAVLPQAATSRVAAAAISMASRLLGVFIQALLGTPLTLGTTGEAPCPVARAGCGPHSSPLHSYAPDRGNSRHALSRAP